MPTEKSAAVAITSSFFFIMSLPFSLAFCLARFAPRAKDFPRYRELDAFLRRSIERNRGLLHSLILNLLLRLSLLFRHAFGRQSHRQRRSTTHTCGLFSLQYNP